MVHYLYIHDTDSLFIRSNVGLLLTCQVRDFGIQIDGKVNRLQHLTNYSVFIIELGDQ